MWYVGSGNIIEYRITSTVTSYNVRRSTRQARSTGLQYDTVGKPCNPLQLIHNGDSCSQPLNS